MEVEYRKPPAATMAVTRDLCAFSRDAAGVSSPFLDSVQDLHAYDHDSDSS